MKLRDYYFGQPVTLRSPLSPDEIAKRIKESTKVQWWWLPFRTGPVGGVRWGRLRLRYARSPFGYNAKPVLVGPLERTMTGTVLRLVYRGPTWCRIFLVFWYAFLALLTIFLIAVGAEPPLQGADRLMPLVVPVVMAVIPIGMHFVGTRHSDADLADLIDFLGRLAGAKPSPE